ncbi:MAG: rRNA (uracil1498-N3)-methyltransferase [Candidatus Parcubacteria bacterium]|jgi:16S rRNA (uracil1498-N3)-methyltransferase|nr:rRNA (uracil1498-N3)-methyltransferase [Candidatus Parcubacteria bacterium]
MRLHRFFISERIGAKTKLIVHSAELVNQIRRVFRLKIGDSIVVFDSSGKDFECTIDSWSGKSIVLHVAAQKNSRFGVQRNIFLCAALVKGDRFERIVEKSTELGVTDIMPVAAERAEKKGLNIARLKKIAEEASEQSGRGNVPALHAVMTLPVSIDFLRSRGVKNIVAFHTEGELFDGMEASKTAPVALFIGPEGGWTEAELALFHNTHIVVRCLGRQVLRAETAAIAALSLIIFGK